MNRPFENPREQAARDVEETLENVAAPSSSSSLLDDRPRVEFVAGARPLLVEETQHLLRSRLRVAVLVLVAPTLFFVFRRFLYSSVSESTYSEFLVMYRYVVCAALVACTGLLWSRIQLSMGELRAIEMVIFGSVCVLMLFSNQHSLQLAAMSPAADPREPFVMNVAGVRLSLRTMVLMWFAIMLIYGTFIPTSLRRGAVVMGAMALAPLAVAVGDSYGMPLLRPVLIPDELSTMIAAMAVAYATALYGSYKISALRREAFEARQLGQYRLTECIGAGGMGEVYLAEHQMLKRPCAIKLIRPNQATDAKALARFEREVRAIARLTHWNSVEIFDYGRADDGTFYYAMEYLPGLSLQEVIERQGHMQPERAVHLLRQVCGALTEAHLAGIIHRDIKPSNIIASQRGGIYDVAKLVDFGLASHTEDKREIKLTQEGAIAGSPLYMAPERFLEEDEPDARCDIYSLGAVGYYLLTGQPPFRGDTPVKVMIAHAREPVVPPRQVVAEIPADVEAVIVRCLAKEPSERYQTTRELEEALAGCGCADSWTQEMAMRWWTSRPESTSGDTQSETIEATMV